MDPKVISSLFAAALAATNTHLVGAMPMRPTPAEFPAFTVPTPVGSDPMGAMPNEHLALFNYTSAAFANAKCPKFAVMHGDWCYATMDRCAPAARHGDGTCDRACQDAPLRLGAGWEAAPHSADVVAAVVAPHDFGTHVVVFKCGRGFGGKHFAGGAGKERHWVTDASGNEHALWCSPTDPRVLRVNACSRKVLMRALPAELSGLAATAALLLRHGLQAHYDALTEVGHVRYPQELLLIKDTDLDELGIRMVARMKYLAMCAKLNPSSN